MVLRAHTRLNLDTGQMHASRTILLESSEAQIAIEYIKQTTEITHSFVLYHLPVDERSHGN